MKPERSVPVPLYSCGSCRHKNGGRRNSREHRPSKTIPATDPRPEELTNGYYLQLRSPTAKVKGGNGRNGKKGA